MGYLITFGFIAFDYVTGLYKAGATRHFSSKIMREGLWHKAGLLLMMCAGFLVDYAQKFVDIGMDVPVGGGVCVYIILMELVSSLENICEGNPEIMPDKLCALFGLTHAAPPSVGARHDSPTDTTTSVGPSKLGPCENGKSGSETGSENGKSGSETGSGDAGDVPPWWDTGEGDADENQ